MNKRKPRSPKERARLFKLFGGKCYLCNGQIDGTKEAWDLEHVRPLSMGGEDEDHNIRLAHRKCHRAKTNADLGQVAQAKRREARHTGTRVAKGTIPAPPKSKREPRRVAADLPELPRRSLYQ